jgi:arsenate reductase
MKDKITVYEKPTCTKCRELNKVLQERALDFQKVNYYLEPLTAFKLKELLSKMQMSARQLLRASEPIYRELGLSKSTHCDEELIALMIKHPDLIQRPIVERGSQAVLCRPVENIKALIK